MLCTLVYNTVVLSLSQRKVFAVVIVAPITVGIAYCLLFADANVAFVVTAACLMLMSGSGQAVVLVVVRLMFQPLLFYLNLYFVCL